MSIDSCYADINKLNSIKSNLSEIKTDLRIAAQKFSPVSYLVFSNYSVNDVETPIASRSKRLYNDMVSASEYITDVVMPSIDEEISSNWQEIARLEEEQRREEEERRRREEEERKKAENNK